MAAISSRFKIGLLTGTVRQRSVNLWEHISRRPPSSGEPCSAHTRRRIDLGFKLAPMNLVETDIAALVDGHQAYHAREMSRAHLDDSSGWAFRDQSQPSTRRSRIAWAAVDL